MNNIQNILSTFIGLTVLKIDADGNILEKILDTKKVFNGNLPKTAYDLFSKEEVFRLKRVIETGIEGKKKYMELNKKYFKDEFVDVEIGRYDKQLYMYIQFFKSNRDREVTYDRYIEKLANLSEKDPLTKVLNRHGFWERIKKLLTYSDPDKRIGILYIDIDDLKKINDQFGHDIGDKAILDVSQTILSKIRQRDIVTRLGGDEFAIVVEEYSGKTSTAYGLAKKLLKEISQISKEYSPTVSIGVHVTRIKTFTKYLKDEKKLLKTWEEELRKADQATYQSKKAGKNQVSVSKEYAKYY